MTIPIRFEERPKSGRSSVSPPTLTKEYFLSGIEDDYIANAYAASAIDSSVNVPQGVLWRQDIQLDHEGHALYGITVTYGKDKRDTGSFKFSFDTTGGTVHITSSKETVGKFPANAADHKQTIGVNGDNVDGADIIIPALKMNYSFKHPAGMVTEAKARYLASVTGMTNSVMWHGFQPGELLLLGATGSDGTDAEAEVNYSVAASANVLAPGLTIGGIANIVKKGHQLAWIAYKSADDGGKAATQPLAVYIERVYDEIDFFAALGF